jgi:hypothetical protein
MREAHVGQNDGGTSPQNFLDNNHPWLQRESTNRNTKGKKGQAKTPTKL